METWQCVYAEAAADGDLGQEIFWGVKGHLISSGFSRDRCAIAGLV
jgi:hypothetical protein